MFALSFTYDRLLKIKWGVSPKSNAWKGAFAAQSAAVARGRKYAPPAKMQDPLYAAKYYELISEGRKM